VNELESASTTVAAGENSLATYLSFGQGMVDACEQGSGLTETTTANMRTNDWSGPRVEHYERGKELLDQARAAFADGVTALEESKIVADAYNAAPGTGNKETATNL
jgi:hypothetical protein